jgi:hypothetical protein
MCSMLAMSLKVKNTFIVVDEKSIQDEEDSISETIWCRRSTAPAATGLRMTQSLPNSPRLGTSAKADTSDTTSVDDTESKSEETGYDTPDEFLDESQSEFSRCWSASLEDAPNYSVAESCVWQGWMVSNVMPFQMHDLGDGLCAPACAPPGAEEASCWEGEVTLMMRNVPKKLTQHALLEEINSKGFAGTYDFVYLPMDQDSKVNRGYAFINFMDPAYAAAFKACYEGRQLNQYSSRKLIAILPAVLQGLEANRAHFSTARVSREDPCARPLFLREPPTSAKSSEVPGQCRAVRAEGAGAKAVASTLKPRLHGESGTATALGAASASVGEAHTSTEHNESVVNFCPYCGGSVGEGFKFCQYCGKSLRL